MKGLCRKEAARAVAVATAAVSLGVWAAQAAERPVIREAHPMAQEGKIQIRGSGFPPSPTVTLSGDPLVVMSADETMIEAELPTLPPGSYELLVLVFNKNGKIDESNSTDPFEVALGTTGDRLGQVNVWSSYKEFSGGNGDLVLTNSFQILHTLAVPAGTYLVTVAAEFKKTVVPDNGAVCDVALVSAPGVGNRYAVIMSDQSSVGSLGGQVLLTASSADTIRLQCIQNSNSGGMFRRNSSLTALEVASP